VQAPVKRGGGRRKLVPERGPGPGNISQATVVERKKGLPVSLGGLNQHQLSAESSGRDVCHEIVTWIQAQVHVGDFLKKANRKKIGKILISKSHGFVTGVCQSL
jgi:hypothetical protein